MRPQRRFFERSVKLTNEVRDADGAHLTELFSPSKKALYRFFSAKDTTTLSLVRSYYHLTCGVRNYVPQPLQTNRQTFAFLRLKKELDVEYHAVSAFAYRVVYKPGVYPYWEGVTVKCQFRTLCHATQPYLLNLNGSPRIMGQQLELS